MSGSISDRAGSPVPSARSLMDRASDYGSEGWGFESLRARSLRQRRKSPRRQRVWGSLRSPRSLLFGWWAVPVSPYPSPDLLIAVCLPGRGVIFVVRSDRYGMSQEPGGWRCCSMAAATPWLHIVVPALPVLNRSYSRQPALAVTPTRVSPVTASGTGADRPTSIRARWRHDPRT